MFSYAKIGIKYVNGKFCRLKRNNPLDFHGKCHLLKYVSTCRQTIILMSVQSEFTIRSSLFLSNSDEIAPS